MLKIGDYNTLQIVKQLDFGMYLRSGDLEILLPNKYIPSDAEVGRMLEVFVYTDSEDRLVATTLKPFAKVNEFACLQAVDTSSFGTFMDIGLEKHVLVPLSEQTDRMKTGRSYVVYVYLDPVTGRMVASAKLSKFTDNSQVNLKQNEEVDLMVASVTPLGYNVIVNNRYMGLVYESETFVRLEPGDKLKGYIKKVREDNKIDISLRPIGFEKRIGGDADTIMQAIKDHGGVLYLSDDSPPEDIYRVLGMSKKAFKKASGVLYREKKIAIYPDKLQFFTPKK